MQPNAPPSRSSVLQQSSGKLLQSSALKPMDGFEAIGAAGWHTSANSKSNSSSANISPSAGDTCSCCSSPCCCCCCSSGAVAGRESAFPLSSTTFCLPSNADDAAAPLLPPPLPPLLPRLPPPLLLKRLRGRDESAATEQDAGVEAKAKEEVSVEAEAAAEAEVEVEVEHCRCCAPTAASGNGEEPGGTSGGGGGSSAIGGDARKLSQITPPPPPGARRRLDSAGSHSSNSCPKSLKRTRSWVSLFGWRGSAERLALRLLP